MSEKHTQKGRGLFITFEGGEGVGKSTQIKHLAKRLRDAGFDVVVSREPGGTPGAEAVRHVILTAGLGEPFGPGAEAMLFAAARNDHVEQVIRPAVERGSVVLVDRFMDSTRVYQGVSGNLSRDFVDALEDVAIAGMVPDLTLVLDLEPETGMARANARRKDNEAADRFEKEQLAVHTARRNGFLALVRQEPERMQLVDADQPIEAISEQIWDKVKVMPMIARRLKGKGA